MSKNDKTSQKLLDSIRKTKASAEPTSTIATPTESRAEPEPSPQAAAPRDTQVKNTVESVRRIPSSRRVWPD